MFDFLSWGHVLVIALAALFIFGPDKLPTLAQDAARGLKAIRGTAAALRAQMHEELGDDLAELRDLDLRRYHPRTFLRDELLGDHEHPAALSSQRGAEPGGGAHVGPATSGAVEAARPAGEWRSPLRALPPPFDIDAT